MSDLTLHEKNGILSSHGRYLLRMFALRNIPAESRDRLPRTSLDSLEMFIDKDCSEGNVDLGANKICYYI